MDVTASTATAGVAKPTASTSTVSDANNGSDGCESWHIISTIEDLDRLEASLRPRGFREGKLLNQIETLRPRFEAAMVPLDVAEGGEGGEVTPGEEDDDSETESESETVPTGGVALDALLEGSIAGGSGGSSSSSSASSSSSSASSGDDGKGAIEVSAADAEAAKAKADIEEKAKAAMEAKAAAKAARVGRVSNTHQNTHHAPQPHTTHHSARPTAHFLRRI